MDITALYEAYLQHPTVLTDTRKLQPGSLFFALRGPSFNGNAFARQALDAGAALVVIDDPAYRINDQCLLVEDSLETLQSLARHHRDQFQIPFLAITGSNGKTTTKELVTTVLSRRFRTYATQGNLNNHIGIPLTLLGIRPDAEMAIIEMGANHLGEIASYCSIARPTHGLITNCGKAHLEGFGSLEGVRKGKGELYDYLRETKGAIFRNTDLEYLEAMSQGIASQITYGSAQAQYCARPVRLEAFLGLALMHAGSETLIPTRLVGDYNFPNVLAATAIGLHWGLPVEEIQAAISGYSPDNSRSQWLQRGSNRIIMDAYNANPSSMKAAILNFTESGLPDKCLWLGAMKEMGAASVAEHAALVRLIEPFEWKQVILVGPEFESLKTNYHWFPNSEAAAAYVKEDPPGNATILIKGSRGSRMEAMLEALPG